MIFKDLKIRGPKPELAPVEEDPVEDTMQIKEPKKYEFDPDDVEEDGNRYKDGYQKVNKEVGYKETLQQDPSNWMPDVIKASGYGRAGYSQGGYRGRKKTVKGPE